MSEEEQLEKKNKRTALIYTTVIQVVFVIALFFIVAWRAPDPPLPEYGIVLNFGTDDQGSGDVQPETPVGNEGTEEEEPEVESKPKIQEETPKVVEEETKPVESKPVEPQVVSKVESPVVVKEKKEEEVKPVEKPQEKKVEPKVEEKPVEKPKVNPEAVYKPNAQQSTSESKSTDAKAGAPGNHGDDPGKTGDKGNPEGSLEAEALYGKPGGGAGGSSLELSGWVWDEKPSPNVPNNESGRLVFEIKVDSNGDIVSIKTLERSVSTSAEQICRRAVEKLTFSKTGANVPEISTGKITFLVRAK
jgi:outer membrane biosynthesis protein TonB